MATAQTKIDIESLFGQTDAALVSQEQNELKTALFTAVETRRSLDTSIPEEETLFYQLYGIIGDLKAALQGLRAPEDNKVSTLTEQAEQALETQTIPALVAAKRQIEEYLGNGYPPKSRSSLQRLSKRLTSAMKALNDAAAEGLLRQFNTHSKEIWKAIDDKNLQQASARLTALLEVASQITDPKPFMRFAIGRVEKKNGGWEGISAEALKSFKETQGAFNALVAENGKEHQKQANALKSRFEASLETGNIGAALSALRELKNPVNAAGLAVCLSSNENRDDFLAKAEERLKAAMQKAHFGRRRRLKRVFNRR